MSTFYGRHRVFDGVCTVGPICVRLVVVFDMIKSRVIVTLFKTINRLDARFNG